MSSAPKDEGGRARRRRRRGGASAPRNDVDHSQPSRPPRRPQQPQQPQQHQQQQQYQPQQQHDSTPRTSGSSGPVQQQTRNARDSGCSQQPNNQRIDSARPDSTDREARPLERQTEFHEQKQKEEEAQREKEAQEAKQRAEREAALSQQLARREQERKLNLSYSAAKSSELAPRERLSAAELRQLDSSLKKCNGFLRKIRSSGVTEESVPALCQEAQSLNLSRYISEVVAAISESKLRAADVEHVVILCGELHRRYEDFISQLVVALGTVILSSATNGTARDLGTRKAAMRLLVEMFVLGMVADVNPVTTVLKQLVRSSKDAKDELLNNLGIVTSFVRAGGRTMLPRMPDQVLTSSTTRESEDGDSDWRDVVLPQSTKTTISSALQSYYDTEVTRLVKELADDLQKAGIAVTRSKNARGDPDEAATEAYDAAKQLYDKVYSSANILAGALGKEPPESMVSVSQTTGSTAENGSGKEISQVLVANPLHFLGKNRPSVQDAEYPLQEDSPFDGEEERQFYTDIQALGNQSSRGTDKPSPANSSSAINGEKAGPGAEAEDSRPAKSASNAVSRSDSKHATTAKTNSDTRRRGSDKPVSIDKLLGRLSSVESKESADAFVAQFVDVAESSKNAPKRLAKSLFSLSAQKLNLLPAYSRIAACLNTIHSEITATIAANLEEEFRYLAGRPDMDDKNLAVCIKNAKYIGEYVKFGLMGSDVMFDLLGLCMKDFTGHRVDIACHLLETCGRFLYRTPSTHIRMGNILETIWRLKSVKNLEARHNALVETAFFAARPSSANKLQKRKCRPPIHEYIRHLIYYRLDATNIKWTQTQFLKLPWDEELEHYVIKKFVKISRARFSTIPYVSTLIALLQRYKNGLVIGIVDALLEAIRSGMEKNDGRDSQRRIAEIQLLGELHKCGVVDERVIYNILYQSITLGHDTSEASVSHSRKASGLPGFSPDPDAAVRSETNNHAPIATFTSAPDPPGDFFRIRIVCVLIESCGRVLVASNRRKVEVFWIFFERYIFCKAFQAGLGDRLPLHIGHVVGDAFEHVLQRERRLSKDSRLRRESEMLGRTGSAQDHSRQFGTGTGFCRSQTLSKALDAVQKVEKSASDTALICVPVRHISQTPQSSSPLNGTRATNNVMANETSTPSQLLGAISLRRKQNGDDDSSSDDDDMEVDGDRGTESLTEDLINELEEDGTLVEGEASLSLDDLDDEDERSHTGDDDPEDDDDDDDDDDEEDEDDDSLLEVRVDRPKTEEEDAFAKELAAFTAAAVQTARASSSRVSKLDRMAIPMSLMTKRMEEERAAAAAAAAGLDEEESISSGDDDEENSLRRRRRKRGVPVRSVEFKMLVRKGGKSQLQDLQVPASSSLALAAKENETADAARHEETKRLVLGSSIVLNHDEDDVDEEVPLRTQQSIREKEESMRQQRAADEMELLSTLYRSRPKTRR